MKAITHNILMCNIKKCAKGDNNYPFIIIPKEIINKECAFDLEFTRNLYERQDKKALNQFCKDLNLTKYDFTNISDDIKKEKEFWEYVHKILNETLINEGCLKCPNCQREFPIKNGIVDMVLRDDEM